MRYINTHPFITWVTSLAKNCVGWCLLHLIRSSVWCPTGLHFGAVIFCSFYSDLPEVVLPGNIIALFADDCKTSRVIDDAGDQVCFQRDLDNLHQWSICNAMAFNVKKCKVMRLTKKRQPLVSNYSLDNSFWVIFCKKYLLVDASHQSDLL